MGGGAAICLARAGRPLTVYDIDPKAALKWEDGHLVPPVAVNCAEVARNSDVVIVLVVDAKQVWSALNGPDGLLAGAHPGLVVVIGSTIALDELTQMREVAKDRKSVGEGKSGSVRVDIGGRRTFKKKKQKNTN